MLAGGLSLVIWLWSKLTVLLEASAQPHYNSYPLLLFHIFSSCDYAPKSHAQSEPKWKFVRESTTRPHRSIAQKPRIEASHRSIAQKHRTEHNRLTRPHRSIAHCTRTHGNVHGAKRSPRIRNRGNEGSWCSTKGSESSDLLCMSLRGAQIVS